MPKWCTRHDLMLTVLLILSTVGIGRADGRMMIVTFFHRIGIVKCWTIWSRIMSWNLEVVGRLMYWSSADSAAAGWCSSKHSSICQGCSRRPWGWGAGGGGGHLSPVPCNFLSYTLDTDLLYNCQGGAVFLQVPNDGSEYLFQWLRVALTLGGTLCTIFNDVVEKNSTACPHCTRLDRNEAVYESVILCSQRHQFPIFCDKVCLRM